MLHWLHIPMSDFSVGGNGKPLISLAGHPAGIDICYEDAYASEILRALPEAVLLINASNDAWFGDSLAPHQHLAMAHMRAAETGRYLLRATNTGISAIIGPDGAVTHAEVCDDANTTGGDGCAADCLAVEAGLHVEVTNLVIPGHNDSDDQIIRLRDHVAALSVDIPLHLSAYHPAWCFDAPPTPPAALDHAAELCAERLHHVYAGNVELTRWTDTRCPGCQAVLISRRHHLARCGLAEPRCPSCGREVPIVLTPPPRNEARADAD